MSRILLKLFLLLALSGLALSSCQKQNLEPERPNVSLLIPSAINVPVGGEITLEVLEAKAPKQTDLLLLSLERTGEVFSASFISVSPERVSFALPEALSESGVYHLSVRRGSVKQDLGAIRLNVLEDASFVPELSSTVYGRVFCEGQGLEGVVISDGVEVVKTNQDGYYQIASQNPYGYVFISVPSGYEVASDGILPQIHHLLKKDFSSPQRADFALTRVPSQNKFRLLVFGDIQLSGAPDELRQLRNFTADVSSYLDSHKDLPIYGLTLGDMTYDIYWYSNNYAIKDYLNSMNEGIKGLSIYHTMGNHDNDFTGLSDHTAALSYIHQIAPTFYSYNIGDWHFVVLDDIDCSAYDGTTSREYSKRFTEDQFAWLEKDLATIDPATPLVISTHAQLFYPSSSLGSDYSYDGGFSRTSNTKQLLSLIGTRRTHVFTGHTHIMYNVNQDENIVSKYNLFEHNSGSVCGTWWWTDTYSGISIGQDGSPAGYQIVSFDGTSISWKFKGTGRSENYQFRTYDRNVMDLSVSKWAPNCTVSAAKQSYNQYIDEWAGTATDNRVYFNVWNYNPRWKIEVTENGKRLYYEKVKVYDPLHIVSYVAPRANVNTAKQDWACTYNNHTFRVKALAPDSTLEFTITDEFGNVYTETMARPKAFTIEAYR